MLRELKESNSEYRKYKIENKSKISNEEEKKGKSRLTKAEIKQMIHDVTQRTISTERIETNLNENELDPNELIPEEFIQEIQKKPLAVKISHKFGSSINYISDETSQEINSKVNKITTKELTLKRFLNELNRIRQIETHRVIKEFYQKNYIHTENVSLEMILRALIGFNGLRNLDKSNLINKGPNVKMKITNKMKEYFRKNPE